MRSNLELRLNSIFKNPPLATFVKTRAGVDCMNSFRTKLESVHDKFVNFLVEWLFGAIESNNFAQNGQMNFCLHVN
jgi:hypothetical protein